MLLPGLSLGGDGIVPPDPHPVSTHTETPIRYRRTHMYILTDATDRLSIMFGDFFQICWVDRNIFKKHTTMMPPWSPVSRSFALYSLVSGSAGNLTTDNVQPE